MNGGKEGSDLISVRGSINCERMNMAEYLVNKIQELLQFGDNAEELTKNGLESVLEFR